MSSKTVWPLRTVSCSLAIGFQYRSSPIMRKLSLSEPGTPSRSSSAMGVRWNRPSASSRKTSLVAR